MTSTKRKNNQLSDVEGKNIRDRAAKCQHGKESRSAGKAQEPQVSDYEQLLGLANERKIEAMKGLGTFRASEIILRTLTNFRVSQKLAGAKAH